MKKVIAVVGPTASGKTKLAIALANYFDGIIISCDSVAVYKECNIGSAKPTMLEQQQAKHYLIDILDPSESFDVAMCQKLAREIIDKEKLSILCGGTGLYINAILKADISNDGIIRDENKMRMLIKSLARNESTIVSNSTLIKDIEDITSNEEYNISRNTVADYLNILEKLYLIENQQPYTFNLRSKERVGKSVKRHFTDPSLACAALAIKPDMLINDIKTFGFMFESLVERDLRIYIESLDGKIYHYRNNDNGLEIDAIVELPSGEYGVIEVKLGTNELDDAKKNLIRFSNEVMIEPKFKCIICGLWNSVVKDPETGIYIIPITALKP